MIRGTARVAAPFAAADRGRRGGLIVRHRIFVPIAFFAVVTAAFSTEAQAQVGWLRLTLAGGAGYADFDESFRIVDDNGIPLEVRAGVSLFRYFGIEGTYGKVHAESELAPNYDFPVDHLGVDLVVNLLPTSLFNPYLLGGWAELRLDQPGADPLPLNGWEYGGGVKVALARLHGARIDLRLEARNVAVENDVPLDKDGKFTNHLFATGGIHMEFFGDEKDTDRDGVADQVDHCPDTPYGAIPDSKGCTMDSDGDGIPDGIDLCSATPAGAVVDSRGCPLDTDNDGVLNGIDQCEGTAEGAYVDVSGCPLDQDGDGVADGLDACADTPAGMAVDASGCPRDSDGDGVLDGYDKCEGTPKGVKVDASGCPLPESKLEADLVDVGVIRLSNIYFDTGTAKLKSESHPVIDEVAKILERWPSLKIEVGGHADAVGPDDMNLDLSRRRAHAVLEYVMESSPQLRFDQFFIRGYGESQPIESNDTPEGRALNRRVEFKVLNREGLPKQP
jgi:outer membrane protein OmpA-like peptidoglycan-associated protein